jgi:hypothetical protein
MYSNLSVPDPDPNPDPNPDPDPSVPHVFGTPSFGSGSISQKYESVSASDPNPLSSN